MKKRRLGRAGIEVFPLAFGGIPIQRLNEEDAVKVVRYAIESGIELIDTARGYTTSEERIGLAIKGYRDDLYLATKSPQRTKEGILEDIQTSLDKLGVDRIDLYQAHGVNSEELYKQIMGEGGALEGLKEAKEQGFIDHIGLSSHKRDILKLAVESGEFEAVQLCFNFIENDVIDEIFPLAKKYDVGVIGMKPMGGGTFTDASLALKYVLSYDIVIPDPGMESIEEVDENVAIAKGSYELSEEELEKVDELREELGTSFCRRCEYCQPCPQDIPISVVLHIQDIVKRMGEERVTSEWIREVYERAKSCTRCEECMPRCPYELPIPDLIAEKAEYIEGIYARLGVSY